MFYVESTYISLVIVPGVRELFLIQRSFLGRGLKEDVRWHAGLAKSWSNNLGSKVKQILQTARQTLYDKLIANYKKARVNFIW